MQVGKKLSWTNNHLLDISETMAKFIEHCPIIQCNAVVDQCFVRLSSGCTLHFKLSTGWTVYFQLSNVWKVHVKLSKGISKCPFVKQCCFQMSNA